MCPAFADSVDPDRLASEEDNWSGTALFVIQCVLVSKFISKVWIKWSSWLGLWRWAWRLGLFGVAGVDTLQSLYRNAGRVQSINSVS